VKDCDFIPADYHAAWTVRQAIRLRAGCIGILISIMVVWVVAHHHRVDTAKAMLPEVARQQEQLTIHTAKKAEMEAERADLYNRQRLLRQLEDQASLVLVLSDISRRMPETIVLTELSADCPSVARYGTEIEPPLPPEPLPPGAKPAAAQPEPKESPPANPRVIIKGIAVDNSDVAQFAAALESSPLFDRIQMEVKEPIVWGGRRAQQFELVCEVLEQQGVAR
jgi:Tfp pilus assembly protein PilN